MKGTKGKHWEWSEESKHKFTGRKLSLEHRKNLSKSHKENPTRYWLGKKRTGQGIGLWMLGRKRPDTSKRLKEMHAAGLSFIPKALKGKENPLWKGGNVGYTGLHNWIRRNLKIKKICNFCGEKNKLIQLANKSGEYKRTLSDWFYLCVSCHKLYDLKRKYAATYPRCWAK